MAEAREDMGIAMLKLRETGIYSDLIIKCGPYEHHVHRAIVCTRSEYFTAACKPDAFREGKEGIIELKAATSENQDDIDADDPEAVKLMIEFLYTNDYEVSAVNITKWDPEATFTSTSSIVDDLAPARRSKKARKSAQQSAYDKLSSPAAQVPNGDCNTVMHAKMYALGDKYAIQPLKDVALGKFAEAVTYAWNHADFLRTIAIVYTTTADEDKGLRDITVRAILDHKDELTKKQAFEETITSFPALLYALWKGESSKDSRGAIRRCGLCGCRTVLSTGWCTYCAKYPTFSVA